ncbi:hypothetical protein V5O48_016053 [Marasmius crinis-equi]|uniref:Uncharacterized protein n=1 Tax=Marasmius crinis-equi TaxID=585013 RepID=A0ABR3ESV9_9AGAR
MQSPASMQEVFMIFSLCQRVYLELVARTVWLSRYEKLVSNPPEYSSVEVANVIGALTDHEEVASRLYKSGIPVWLVRPIIKKDAFRVDRWLEIDYRGSTRSLGDSGFTVDLEDDSPSREVIYDGRMGTLDRYAAMARYIRRFTTTNVFMDEKTTTPQANIPSCVGPTRSAKSGSARSIHSTKGKGRKGVGENDRNKFIDVVSPLMPSSLANWSRASTNAGSGFDPNSPSPDGRDNGYALLDPGVIAGSKQDPVRAAFFATWLRLRPVLLYRLLSPAFRPMKTKDWRSVLGIQVHGQKSDTRAAERRTEQQEMLQKCLTSGGMQGTVDLSNLDATPVQWLEQPLQASVDPPAPIARQILCELFEINFRYELVALDRFCYQKELSTSEREHEVLGVLTHFHSRLIPDPTDLGKTGFASSQRNERRHALHGFHFIMQGWSGGPGELSERLKDPGISRRLDIAETEDITTTELDDVEYALVFHYVSTFRKIFVCAPLLPHRL